MLKLIFNEDFFSFSRTSLSRATGLQMEERATPHQGYVLYKMQSGAEICGVQGHRAYDGRLRRRLQWQIIRMVDF